MWYMTACTKSSSRVCLLLLGAKWTTCIKPSTVISEIQSILHLPVDLHPPWLVQNAPFRKSPRAPTFSRIQLFNCSAGNLDFSLCPSTTPRGRGPRMDRCHTVPRQPGGPPHRSLVASQVGSENNETTSLSKKTTDPAVRTTWLRVQIWEGGRRESED